MTGNLQIIKNNKLRKLFTKGPKYREPQKINWEKAKNTISNGVEVFVKSLSDNKGVDVSYFDNWKFSLMNLVEEKISMYASKVNIKEVSSVLKDCNAKNELNKLHQDFIVVPIDKASSNVAFICKRHYADVILDELKFSTKKRRKKNADTYENIRIPPMKSSDPILLCSKNITCH